MRKKLFIILAKEDFNDDTKDAGELGAGHTVTAIYEIVPIDSKETFGDVDDLKYQKTVVQSSNDLLTVKLRYKQPNEDKSQLITRPLTTKDILSIDKASNNLQFASAVAEFGLLLRDSKHKGTASYQHVLDQAKKAKGEDKWGYRVEFINLVTTAQTLAHAVSGGYQFK